MRFGKTLCGITATAVILGSMAAISSSEIIQAEASATTSTSITEDGITYRENEDGTLAVNGVSSDIVDLVIPETVNGKKVTEIRYLGSENTTIRSISIPSSIEGIDYFFPKNAGRITDSSLYIFNSSNLTEIKVDSGNPYFYSEDGVLFAKNDQYKFLCYYPEGKEGTTYTIPDGVTNILGRALADSKIEILNIPASVTYIADESAGRVVRVYLSGMDNLKQINVDPDNTKYFSSGGALFEYDYSELLECEYKILLRYPSGKTGGDFIVPDGVSDLANLTGAELDSLYIPVSVKESPYRFEAKDVYYAGSETQFKEIRTEEYLWEAAIKLYDYCKENNIPVHYNVKAPSQTDSDITYTENEDGTLTASVAESARETITSLTIPETVNGKKVTTFSLIDSVSDYGYGPTYNGYTLPELKSLSLPASLTDVKLCEGGPLLPKLTEIKVDSKNPVLYVEDNVLFKKHDEGITMVLYPSGKTNTSYTIPEGVTDSDFRLALINDYLKTLNFPSTLADIGDTMIQGAGRPLYAGYYFADVSEINVDPKNETFASVNGNLYSKDMGTLIKYLNKTAKTYVVPDGVEYIQGNQSFYGETIYIPKSVHAIGFDFLMQDNIKDIYYAGSEEEWEYITALGDFYNGIISQYHKGTVHFNTSAPTVATVAPTKPASSAVTANGVTLTWGKVDGATAYIIKYSLDGGKTWITKTVTTNSIVLSELTPNTSYIYRIAAKSGDIEGVYTTDYTFKTTGSNQSKPTSSEAQSGSDNPPTGAVLVLLPVAAIGGAVAVITRKRRK